MSAPHTDRLRPVALPGPQPFDGRLLDLPPGRYDWLHLAIRATGAATGTVWLHYADGADPEQLEVAAGESVAVRVPVTRREAVLHSVRLPERPGLDLLSLTTVSGKVKVTAS